MSKLPKPKVYDIDNVLRGYNDFNKLANIYLDLRRKVLQSEPVQRLSTSTITITWPNWRGGRYGWELYKQNNSVVMLEMFMGGSGYKDATNSPIIIDKESHLNGLRVTVHNSNPEIEDGIEAIISRYPRESRKQKVEV